MSFPSTASVVSSRDHLHAWESGGATSAEALTAWVSARLAAHEAALTALKAVTLPRTVENTLRLYDKILEELMLAGSQVGVLNSVAAAKAVRDRAQDEAQRVAMAASSLSLNRDVYDALAAIDLSGANAPTRHYVERTLLGYRLAGVDKDEATRVRLQELQQKSTLLSLEFGRNIQEGAKTVTATVDELAGLPEDYIARHQPGADGLVTISTDQPDMQPVMTFARSAALRERMFLAYNTRAYPANQKILLDLLATRQEIADILGFRSWADLATADQMMGSAANVRTFLAKLDEASRGKGTCAHPRLRARRRCVDQGGRHRQPWLLVRAFPPRALRLRFAVRAALLPVCAGRGWRACDRREAARCGVPPRAG